MKCVLLFFANILLTSLILISFGPVRMDSKVKGKEECLGQKFYNCKILFEYEIFISYVLKRIIAIPPPLPKGPMKYPTLQAHLHTETHKCTHTYTHTHIHNKNSASSSHAFLFSQCFYRIFHFFRNSSFHTQFCIWLVTLPFHLRDNSYSAWKWFELHLLHMDNVVLFLKTAILIIQLGFFMEKNFEHDLVSNITSYSHSNFFHSFKWGSNVGAKWKCGG